MQLIKPTTRVLKLNTDWCHKIESGEYAEGEVIRDYSGKSYYYF